MAEVLLSVQGLSVDYVTPDGALRAVDNVSLDIARGEVVGLAGESGSGKSTLVKALLRILPPPGLITGGHALFDGVDLMALDDDGLRRIRWAKLSMVFQSAMDALNPVLRISDQIEDTLLAHGVVDPAARRQRICELLDLVELPQAVATKNPHQLSGGMRQRAVIAISLALSPEMLILDEPTTALDVVTERAILERLLDLRDALGFSVLFITHDLPLMLDYCDRVGVMYGGRLAEIGPTASIVGTPKHPYTAGLLQCFPSLKGERKEIAGIPGTPPSIRRPPSGCRFHPRCPHTQAICATEVPAIETVAPGHRIACWLESGQADERISV